MKNRQAVFLGLVQCGAERQKPPQAGSHKSLMYLAKSKELFCYKGCKFAIVGVDQTLRRPLTVLLLEIAVEDRTTSKISGQFQKAKLRLRRLFLLRFKTHHRPTPAPLRVTDGRECFQRESVILREPRMRRVEVLRRRKGVYAVRSKTAAGGIY